MWSINLREIRLEFHRWIVHYCIKNTIPSKKVRIKKIKTAWEEAYRSAFYILPILDNGT